MGTNGTDIAAELRLDEEKLHIQKVDYSQAPGPMDKTAARKRALDNRAPDAEYVQFAGVADPVETAKDFALAPLVDKIAYGIAIGLVVLFLQIQYQFFPLDPTVYIIPAIPVEIHWFDFASIALASMGLSWLAAYYPARRAAATLPAEALRWE